MSDNNYILIVNSAEPGIKEFTDTLEEIIKEEGLKPVILEYKECSDFNFDSVKAAILSGSPQGNDIVEHHLPYFRWLSNFNKPILGICAGHHISGFLNGSKILRSKEPESGIFEIQIVKNNILFEGMTRIFTVRQMHNDSITLPDNFELLATSETCNNQLMKHKKKKWYTCQFHPEYFNHDLIKNFLKICKK